MNLSYFIKTMNYPLKMFNSGQITLPKKWREQYDTHSIIAEETSEGLLIKPILTNSPSERSIETFIENFKVQVAKQGFTEKEIDEVIAKIM